jgi:hypothetical protein
MKVGSIIILSKCVTTAAILADLRPVITRAVKTALEAQQ